MAALTQAQRDALTAAALIVDKAHARWWGEAFGGFLGLMMIVHVTRALFHYHRDGKSPTNIVAKLLRSPFRLYRRFALIYLPKFTSGGHIVVLATYLAINLAITFHGIKFVPEWETPAKRCGWMAACNFGLVFFLSLKNTIFSSLTGYSHERLNILHRFAARTGYIYATLHMSFQCTRFKGYDDWEFISERPRRFGWAAFACFSIIMFTSMKPIRRHFYEYFYLIHVVFFTLAAIMLCFHDIYNMKIIPIMGITLAVLDRSIRIIRTYIYSRKMTARIYPLNGGGTKVKIVNDGKLVNYQPGSHAFLGIPGLARFQSHPFTISTRKEAGIELTIRSMSGFTKALSEAAIKTPGAEYQISFDGPYGRFPDFPKMSHLLLVAGGSGASFTFPIAMDILNAESGRSCTQKIVFVWAIKDSSQASWFHDDLLALQNSPLVQLHVHVTGSTSTESPSPSPETDGKESTESKEAEISLVGPHFEYGRPDLVSLVKRAILEAGESNDIGIAVCGPKTMIKTTRNSAAKNLPLTGASVFLHCEQFGWG